MAETSFDFTGETVIVTGGSSGIGREIAIQYADAGATVVLGDIKPTHDHIETPTHEAIEDQGGSATFVEMDVSQPAEISRLIETAREYGGVDVMVNNAGVNLRTSIRELTEEQYDFVQKVNLKGVIFGTKLAAEDMVSRGTNGKIVNTASIRTDTALSGQIMYNSTKGGVKMVTRSAALEYAEDGIRVNGISPGRTVTALADTTANAEEMAENEQLEKAIPMNRPADPSEIAPTVLYITSEQTEYMTGEIVTVDGGLSIY